MDQWRSQFPLRAHGCRLLNQFGQHFKLAGVNWYGASDSYHVVGGLDVRPLSELCHAIASMGFSVVRLPFSSEMLRIQEVPTGAIDYTVNKELEGLSPLQVYDRVIEELGSAGVTVMINNHTTVGAWSGGVELNGMWFRDQCKVYTEQAWIDDWVMMAKRYEDYPEVIGYDIRNEVRPTSMMGPSPRWGTNNTVYDWSRAAGSCARALMDANAPGLIVVERIAWPQNSLREMLTPLPWDAWGVPRDRIVLALHMYAWSGPGSWSPKHFMPGVLRSVFDVVDYVGARSLYGEMSQDALEEQMDKDFGFCIDEDICPVWLSELGCSLDSELTWFGKVCQYLDKKDVDFAYWPLNVGPKPGGSDDEAYGILTNDWQPRWADPRLQALRRLCPQPALPSPKKAATRRPLQLPRARADSGTSLSPFHLNITPNPTPVATPSCYGHVDEPLWGAPFPWCQPLPGPLVAWPNSSRSPKEIPEARYIWKVLEGVDSDPGKDALTVRCDDLEAVKELCIRRHFGGFALHEGYAYFRLSSPEGLLMRQRSGYPNTVLYVAQEVRLCGTWQCVDPVGPFQASGDVLCLPLGDEYPEATLEACQRACLEAEMPGFVLHDFASACLIDPSEADDLRLRLQQGEARRIETTDAGIYLLEPKPFYIGVEIFKDMDAFSGSDARVLKGNFGIARCREICIQEGFAGFAIQDGVARFRSAAASVLRERLVPSKGVVFYILTSQEVLLEDDPQRGQAALDQVLTKLWSPTQAVLNGSKLQHKVVEVADLIVDEEEKVIHI